MKVRLAPFQQVTITSDNNSLNLSDLRPLAAVTVAEHRSSNSLMVSLDLTAALEVGVVDVVVGEDEAGVEEGEAGGLGGRTATAAVIAVLTCRWNPPTPLCPS